MSFGGGPRRFRRMAYAIFIFASCGTQSLFAKIPNTLIWNKIKTQCATYLPDCELSFQLLEDLRKDRIGVLEAEAGPLKVPITSLTTSTGAWVKIEKKSK